MTSRKQRRGRPPVHDPALIRGLLAERKKSGETYAELEERSGIPASTLSRWSRRLAGPRGRRSDFVELVVDRGNGSEQGAGAFEISIALLSGGSCQVLVPAGFAASELRRLLAVLEDRC